MVFFVDLLCFFLRAFLHFVSCGLLLRIVHKMRPSVQVSLFILIFLLLFRVFASKYLTCRQTISGGKRGGRPRGEDIGGRGEGFDPTN